MTTQAINADTADIPSVNFSQQSGDVAAPAAGRWQLFFKAGGLYARSNAGGVIGPFATEAGQTLTIKEIDGAPSGEPTTLEFPNGTVSDQGGGTYRYTPTEGGVPAGFYGFTKGATLAGEAGETYNRTSGASWTTLTCHIVMHQPVWLTSVKWDLKAGTYDLVINGAAMGQVVLGSDGEGAWDLSAAQPLCPPGVNIFQLTSSVPNTAFRDCAANVQTWYQALEPSYYDGTTASYSAACRLNGYLGAWEEIA